MTKKDLPKKKTGPSVLDCVGKRDYTGAIAILEFQLKTEEDDNAVEKNRLRMWIAYCASHLGLYQKAYDAYLELQPVSSGGEGKEEKGGENFDEREVALHKGCCLYYLQMYKEATDEALKGSTSELQNRILFHCAHKLGNEDKLLLYHQKLTESKVDQLSLAAIHYLRNHYQEATDVFKRLLLENRDDIALNIYVAMCYYRLDYYDVSLEIMQAYLHAFPDSTVAINIKACNQFKLYNGSAAKDELRVLTEKGYDLSDSDIISHNVVVFDDGKNAMRVLPGLVDVLPEARLNLVVYHLRNEQIDEAYELLKDTEPSSPPEYILKGVVHATLGQATSSRQHVKTAQQYFQLVGASATECDTIPGRQCMASCFFLLKQFEDVNTYLSSIKQYLYNDDNFNWNYGIALASNGKYADAQETLLLVQNEKLTSDYCYLSWLCRSYIMNKNASAAWELYLKIENTDESFNLLQLIANDCYRMGLFLYAAKAFDVLERLEPDPEYWEGKRGACVGVFQQLVAGNGNASDVSDILQMITSISNPQVEYIVRSIKKWCNENQVELTC